MKYIREAYRSTSLYWALSDWHNWSSRRFAAPVHASTSIDFCPVLYHLPSRHQAVLTVRRTLLLSAWFECLRFFWLF